MKAARAPALGAALALFGGSAAADDRREIQLGLENLYYRTAETALNRGNVLGLDPAEDLLRATGSWRERRGPLRLVARGYVEQRWGGRPRTDSAWRELFAQYDAGHLVSVRAGRQRLAWGSGFAWNPTSRAEAPKSPLNTSLDQPGADAVRLDFVPAAWGSLTLLAARADTAVGDLPFEAPARRRRTGAVRARALVRDTDVALVMAGGKGQRTLVGVDLARGLGGGAAAHLEAATYLGAEMPPARDEARFTRVAAGVLWPRGEAQTLALEYFYNGEGYAPRARDVWLTEVEGAARAAADPALPSDLRARALATYVAAATVPYAGGLGLRRHYLHASWTRAAPGAAWTASTRAVIGLEDGGLALTPGLGWSPRGNLTLQLDAILLLGPPDAEYRLAPVRTAVQLRARALF